MVAVGISRRPPTRHFVLRHYPPTSPAQRVSVPFVSRMLIYSYVQILRWSSPEPQILRFSDSNKSTDLHRSSNFVSSYD